MREMYDFSVLKLIFLSYLITPEIDANLKVYNNDLTWADASDRCGSGYLEYDLNLLEDIQGVKNNEEIWIGKALYRLPYVEIIGCFNISSMPIINTEFIGQCLGRCNFNVIGYQEHTKNCICMGKHLPKSNTTLNITTCNQTLPTAYFVYKEYQGDVKSEGFDSCVTIECIKVENQIIRHKLDQTCKATIAAKCGQNGVKNWKIKSYSDELAFCMSKNQLLLPSTYCNTLNPEIGIPFLSNVFQEKTMGNFTKQEAGNLTLIRCFVATVKMSNGHRILQISQKHCDDHVKWFVCNEDASEAVNVSTSSISRSTTSDILTTSGNNELTNKGATTFFKSTRTKGPQDITTVALSKLVGNQYRAPEIGTIVGITIGSFVVVMVVIIILFCRMRSLWIFKSTKDKSKDSSTAIYEVGEPPTHEKSRESLNNPSYFFHDINIQPPKFGGSENGSQVDLYTTTAEGEYDRLNDIEQRKVLDNENTYDCHVGGRNEADPTYDTAQHSSIQNIVQDIYDHGFEIESHSIYEFKGSG